VKFTTGGNFYSEEITRMERIVMVQVYVSEKGVHSIQMLNDRRSAFGPYGYPKGGNFINVKHARFSYKLCFGSFF
jgi:hypothetical protein